MTTVDVDLFAGPGGWDTGAADIGIVPVGIEIDSDPCRTARAFGHERQHADVAELNPLAVVAGWADELGGLIASPPCQGFSTGGLGKSRDDSLTLLDELGFVGSVADMDRLIVELGRNLSDPRTVLVLEPLRWAMVTRPRWLAWEQVPSVLPIWEASATLLRAMGYSVRTGILTAETFGVPQTRRRAFLVARRIDVAAIHGTARFPSPTHARYRHGDQLDALELDTVRPWVSMAEALGWGGTVGFPRRADRDDVTTIDGVDYRARDLRDVTAPAQVVTEKARSWTRFTPAGRPVVEGLQPRDLTAPAHTITGAGSAVWLDELDDDAGLRVTVEEAAALQTFPDGYPWHGTSTSRFQQIGDAVPPLLARKILEAIAA